VTLTEDEIKVHVDYLIEKVTEYAFARGLFGLSYLETKKDVKDYYESALLSRELSPEDMKVVDSEFGRKFLLRALIHARSRKKELRKSRLVSLKDAVRGLR
jgi:hypothetical protein